MSRNAFNQIERDYIRGEEMKEIRKEECTSEQSDVDAVKARLLPCPFCGGEPEMTHKGNKFTDKRSVTIKCKKCRAQRTDAAMRFGMDWLESVAIDHWNQRIPSRKP